MIYKVLHQFADLQDHEHVYRVGDVYPHSVNVEVSGERLEELLTAKNRIGIPLIEQAEEKKEETEQPKKRKRKAKAE